jgi:glucose/mannose-6-phosphate isomerase
MPVACGAGLTAPVARRWKTQMNENAKLQAFFSELPEADHNEICGWGGLPEGARPAVLLIEDPDQGLHMKRRFELTAAAIAADGVDVVRVEAKGHSRTARVFWAVMLGDLVSLELAAARGADPLAVAAIDSLKSELAGP